MELLVLFSLSKFIHTIFKMYVEILCEIANEIILN